ncbi:hypothetical protein, partial [Streptococcus pluranimalium]|uniref:hypothetical protein n=1 Tax=Streptococcus pluranimalium TaxID=82348 RepID=UPI0039E9B2D8
PCLKQLIRLQANLIGRNRRGALAPSRESGARGSYFSGPLALAGKSGLQPQSKPPVHTGGFDLKKYSKKAQKYFLCYTVIEM